METQEMELTMQNRVKHLFDEEVALTGIIEYGVSWEDLLAGKAEIPANGARFDISFEGTVTGEEISGKVKGIDYLEVRADGKFMLNLQATIVTSDGESIALKEDGILIPNANGTGDLYLNMQFSTASPKYQWINKKQVWGICEANMLRGTVKVKGYSN